MRKPLLVFQQGCKDCIDTRGTLVIERTNKNKYMVRRMYDIAVIDKGQTLFGLLPENTINEIIRYKTEHELKHIFPLLWNPETNSTHIIGHKNQDMVGAALKEYVDKGGKLADRYIDMVD